MSRSIWRWLWYGDDDDDYDGVNVVLSMIVYMSNVDGDGAFAYFQRNEQEV